MIAERSTTIGYSAINSRTLPPPPAIHPPRLTELDPNLAFVIKNESLLITTVDAARKMRTVRTYDVSNVLGKDETAEELAATVAKALDLELELKTAAADKPAAEAAKKPAKGASSGAQITSFRNQLIVRGIEMEQFAVKELLESIALGLKKSANK